MKRYILLTLLAFLVTTLPFVAWNHSNHGMMKLTPLEGGAGVAHMGYWSFKLPGNYAEKFYWGITVFPDITNPFTYTSEEYERNISAFESEWKGILKDIDKYLAPEDLKYIEIMKKEREVRPGMFVLYNSVYTSERELALWKALIRDVIDDPYFYLKTRVYTFFRLFFVGLNPDSLDNAETLQSETKVIYPFLVTFVTVFAGFIFCTIYLMRFGKQVERNVMFIYSVVVFQGAIHVPFAIQSRFMVPVHFFIFIMVSILISRLKVFERYHLKSESSCALSH